MTIKLNPKTKSILLLSFIAVLILGSIYFIYLLAKLPTSLDKDLTKLGKAGEKVKEDYFQTETLNITQTQNNYQIKDFMVNGPIVKLAGQDEGVTNKEMQIEFPKDYKEPINIKLDRERTITITDKNNSNYKNKTLVKESQTILDEINNKNPEDRYLKYESSRKSIYYAYQRNEQERELKNWIIYNKKDNNQEEQEEYQINNAKIKLNEQGEIEVFYFTAQDIENQETIQNVDSSLLERAQRTLMKESGEDILNNNKTPDFIIPKPYYINNQEEKINLNWEIDQETNTIKLNFNPKEEEYPVAVDPTFQFVVPGLSNSSIVIKNNTNNNFGYSIAAGDLNADGKTDLLVGSLAVGKVYVFYNDGSYHSKAGGADLIIEQETASTSFAQTIITGDFNNDNIDDIVVAAPSYSSNTGRVYIFYSDGSYPSAENADVIINGEASNNYFGWSFAMGNLGGDSKADLIIGSYVNVYVVYNDSTYPTNASTSDIKIVGDGTSGNSYSVATGDFDYDGDIDLVAGSHAYSSSTGRVYLFYNDGSIPTNATSADLIIGGVTSSDHFGSAVLGMDVNYDGRTDLVVGAYGYSSFTGRVYVFYNDGSIPATAASADFNITGEATGNAIGLYMACGDFNYDSRVDLALGSDGYSSNTGRTYIFYNDGSIPTAAGSADVVISGESGSRFGGSLKAGDFNNDSRVDLAVGGWSYDTNSYGRLYIFYNDGTIPTTAATADIKITGNTAATGSYFAYSMTSGDLNGDQEDDLVISEPNQNSNTGRIFIFYNTNDKIVSEIGGADVIIDGGYGSSYFGSSMTTGDFNGDGRTDLLVGAYGYTTNTGQVYVFYSDGTNNYGNTTCGNNLCTAINADVTIAGGTTNNYFGRSVGAGDFNADGKDDIVVGADGYSTNTGRVYVFYTDGSIPANASSADITITGETTNNYFGYSLNLGDIDGDDDKDLMVGAYGYSTNTGRVYVFNNDGSVPTTGATADNIISGEGTNNYFSYALGSFDNDKDGDYEIVIGAYGYDSNRGRAYVFYSDGSYVTGAGNADLVINGIAGSRFGNAFAFGDFDYDEDIDFVVAGYYASSHSSYTNNGSVYMFYNDGSYPTWSAEAEVIVSGEQLSNYFGNAICAGDFNNDRKDDLAVGAYGYNATNTGRAYIIFPDKMQLDNVFNIQNEGTDSNFGAVVVSGDLDNDGNDDLAVSSTNYNNSTGRVYIFYNDGSISTSADGADFILDGEVTGDLFGSYMKLADFNSDGKDDLLIGARSYNTLTGRVYIFLNDGSYPSSVKGAEFILTGSATNIQFGYSFAVGDFNYDGKNDIAVGAIYYSSNAGAIFVFYNDGSMPIMSAGADVIITGEATSYLGSDFAVIDANNDGKEDIVSSAFRYSTYTGRVYVFYCDGSIPTAASSADVIITGGAISNDQFGRRMGTGDFNNDGRKDLIIGSPGYSSGTGRVYISYNDGTFNMDITVTGDASSSFGSSVAAGDFNGDNIDDLVAGGPDYATNSGRIGIFYNDGSMPTLASNADFKTNGQTGDQFTYSLALGDIDDDGKDDLISSSPSYSTNLGRVQIFYNDESLPTSPLLADIKITGESLVTTTNHYFGQRMRVTDLNQDGEDDLVATAPGYSNGFGRVYIFYSKSNFRPFADEADVIIEGGTNYNFGSAIEVGDFNNDNKTDLLIGANGYSAGIGAVFVYYTDGTNNFGNTSCTGSAPTICQAINADIKFDGASGQVVGSSIAIGDLNSDGKNDLALGADSYSTNTGRVYLIYQDVVYPSSITSANVIITGGATNNNFGGNIQIWDINKDNRADLVVTALGYSSGMGAVYIFYNDGSYVTSAGSADVQINGESSGMQFGKGLVMDDFDNDNYTDLVVLSNDGTPGKVYFFYADGTNNLGKVACTGSAPTTCQAVNADWIIDGVGSYNLAIGAFIAKGDMNKDGKMDLIAGNEYKVGFVFYNDGTYPSSPAGADVTIIGDSDSGSDFAKSFAVGDFNDDNIIDLLIGAPGYNSYLGKIYSYNFAYRNPENTVEFNADKVEMNAEKVEFLH